MADNDSEDSERGLPPHLDSQRHYRRQKGGWQGEELELERRHELEKGTGAAHAAVDLNQFRNTKVGEGYQAKHVIRQRSSVAVTKDAAVPSPEGKDVTGADDGTIAEANENGSGVATSKSNKKRKTRDTSARGPSSLLQKYLQCEGLRTFRKELALIEASVRKDAT